jgi:amino acid adenylation domain-containing protein
VSRPVSAVEGARRGLEAFDAIDESCRKFPGRAAAEWKGRGYSYADLDAAARGLVSRMDEQGAPPGAPVGALFDDRVAVIAAMLASFRSGRVFVPLDPEAPPARTREILMDAEPACVLVEASLRDRAAAALEGLPAPEIVVVDPYEGIARRGNATVPAGRGAADPDAPAYLSYTSGSTGRPKGIAGRLRGLSHFVRWELEEFGMGEGARVSQLTVPTFDAYFRDVLVPLAVGGTVCIPPMPLRELVGETLAAWIEESRIETLHCVPSLLAALLDEPLGSGRFPALRRVLVAGEVLHVEEARRWLELFGDRIALVNLYGPSETTMVKFFHRVEPRDLERGFVPIGKPMPGAQGMILAPDGSPCPPGVVGELFIRTPYRTLGYYRRPDLTARAFVRNPFRDDPEDLLYRTGDLARVLPDGNLQFLGRRDDQVKIRGLRVELSEIEGHLRSHPEVREAAVESVGAGREPRLIAFVAPRGGRALSPTELRSFLKNRLPGPMIPADWAVLDALPRTSTGKVDRGALGRMRPDPAPGRTSVAPRTEMEERVAEVWREVLGTGPMSREDDFFEQGGHSLRAMQVVSRLRKTLGRDLAVRTLFENTTLAGFARAISDPAASAAAPAAQRAPEEPSLVRRDRTGAIPLSFGQEGLWFLDQLEGGAANNISRVLRLSGHLDEKALQDALTRIAGRHESVRTTFVAPDGRPEQRISDGHVVPLTMRDLRDVPEEIREREARRLIEEEVSRPFDLSRDLMLRATLLRVADEESVLALVMHHIASDGWSMGVLTRELSAAYAPFGAVPLPLPDLPIQYADYADWQRDWLQGERLGDQIAFWKRTLGGPSVSLELPADRRRPAEPSRKGASLDFALPDSLTASVKRLGLAEGTTLFMTLLAGFYALLHRYTGATDLRVGSFITNRGRTELEPLIGFFINTLVLRTDLSGDPSFRELLGRVREATLQAYSHPDVPFERLLEELHPERHLSRTPLFQVAFVLQNTPKPPVALSGLEATVLQTERRRSRHDLTFMLWERPTGLTATVTYSPDLFDPATVSRLFGHYGALLEEVAAAPGRRLSELSLLSPAERDQLVRVWNATDADFPAGRSFAEIFEEQAARDPGRVAARCGDREATYGELSLRIARGARELARRGIGPEAIVPILAGRGLDFLAAMLSVFRAGAAYLPLDPGSPPERLARMIRESGCPLVFVSREFAALLDAACRDTSPGEHPAAVSIESLGRSVGEEPAVVLPRSGQRTLTYVIYTSGSTGLPKGAMVEQAGMLNHLFSKVAALGLTPEDVVAQTAPQSFDISVWQYLAPLLVGGRVEIFPDEIAHDPARLLAETERSGVTVLETVPSLLRAALDEREAGGPVPLLRRLRWLLATGEALPPSLGARWLEAYPRIPLMNAYGPTECSDDVTHFVLREPAPRDAAHVPIGRPLPNMRMYVTGPTGLPVPLGVAGELRVGGVGVGRGYLGDPARTAEAFVPDPFGGEPGARLYRTGDLVRYEAGGDLVYLGRIDQQVKVRGCRIELGEIEAAMAAHPGVREAVVAARAAPSGDLRLAAYFVPSAGELSAGELRSFLAVRLPAFMLPSAFVALTALPLTPNGKIDRKALPDPEPESPDPALPEQGPRNAREAEVCRIWAALLGRERIGIHEDFFELGGHSLLAIQVISRMRKAFGVTLSIRTLFERTTVAGLAEAVEAARKSPDGAIPALVTAGEAASEAPSHD